MGFHPIFYLCVGHGTYLASESLVTGVITKCSEPQAVDSNVKGGGSGVAKSSSLRTETDIRLNGG